MIAEDRRPYCDLRSAICDPRSYGNQPLVHDKVVAYGGWSLTRSGRFKRVDCTLFSFYKNLFYTRFIRVSRL